MATKNKTIINIKTDKSLKEAAQETAREMGVPLGTAINAFLKQFVREKELTLSANKGTPTPYLRRVIMEAKKEYEAGEASGPYTAKAFIEHLKKL